MWDWFIGFLHEIYILPFEWPDDFIAAIAGVVAGVVILWGYNKSLLLVFGRRQY